MPETFHFLQPEWFLVLLPLALLIWRVRKAGSFDSAWRRVCDANLLPYLLISRDRADGRLPLWLLAAGWLLAVFALADPVWEKQPQPVFRTEEARVVVLDLSRSMEAADLKPSRLERARYKVEDVLRRSREGQVGLVAFAGDAFVVAPLTHDAGTITELLKALEPGLMPVQGSRADLGLRKAGELLAQAGAGRGEILLIADGYEDGQALDAAGDLKRQGYTVSVLGIGTAEGAPLSNGSGGYLHDAAGAVVVPRLDEPSLRTLADAGGGHYATLSGNDADLNALLTPLVPRLDTKVEETGLATDAWRSRGPWLAVLLLPLAALAFRRGWLLGLLLLVAATVAPPQPAVASTWDDLWTRRDQQAAQALEGGDNARAAELASDPLQRGTAQYRAGQYEQSLESFSKASGTDAAYNQGNALARLGRYPEAIAAYDKALAAQPHMEDAQHNKAVVEALLREQEKQQQERQQQGQSSGESSSGTAQQDGSEADSSTPSGKQDAPRQSVPGQEDSAAPSAHSEESQEGEARKPSADASRDERDKAQANDETASRDEAQSVGQEGAGVKDKNAASEAGQSSARNATDTPQATPAADTKAPASAQDSPESPNAARQQTAEGQAGEEPAENPGSPGAQAAADPQPTEEQQATEQWLRRIPDDPGGLLRRKFLYQYRQRAADATSGGGQGW